MYCHLDTVQQTVLYIRHLVKLILACVHMYVLLGNVAGGVGGALEDLFFGPKHDQKLTIDGFRDFHQKLNAEILQMEVSRMMPHIHVHVHVQWNL